MKAHIEIQLTQGKTALADAADWELVLNHVWHAVARNSGIFYASTNVDNRPMQMHRLLLPHAEKVDHINGNGLDNRRENLRSVTHAENMRNRKRHKNNQSGFKGVYAAGLRWRAQIKANGTKYTLGYFDSPELAAEAYDEAARGLHGEHARTNF